MSVYVDQASLPFPVRIGGVFRVNEIDALFDSLHLTFGLKIERVNPKLVRISKKA